MSSYQPKLNPEALVAGYTGADPKVAGALHGYLTRQTPETTKTPERPTKDAGRRENPYLKK